MYGDRIRLQHPRLYEFWARFKNQCNNPKNKSFKNVGALGITFYAGWLKYEDFMKWAIDNGWDETKYINRIDFKSNFSPDNCIIENKPKYNTITKRNLLHKTKSQIRLYRIWSGMIQRCINVNLLEYKNYGERGIKVCKEWRESFQSFKEWAINNGYNDNLTIDRIDVNGNYEPSNCRWFTWKEQANNKRTNRFVIYKNKKYTVSQLADKFNIPYDKLYSRLFIYPFWDVERAVSTS